MENFRALGLADLQPENTTPVVNNPILDLERQRASRISDSIPAAAFLYDGTVTSLNNPNMDRTITDSYQTSRNSTTYTDTGLSWSGIQKSETLSNHLSTLSSPDTLKYGSPSSRASSGMNLSFAGCGFLGIYHVGAAACLRKYAPELPIDFIAGASAGSMAASCLLSNANLGVIRDCIIRSASEARSRTLGPFCPFFDIQKELRNGLTQVLPANAHELVSGRLFVSVTRISDSKNILLSQFGTRDELVQALLCSSFIPMFSGLRPMSFRGVRYIDGGFSDNLPVHDHATVTVSPFSGEADICPKDSSSGFLSFSVTNTNFQLSRRNIQRFVHALFPPSPETLQKMCQQGFNDTLDFLQRNNLVSCKRCSAVLSSVSLSPVTSREESVSGSDKGECEEDVARCTMTPATSDQALESDLSLDSSCSDDNEKKVYFDLSCGEESDTWEQSCVNCPHCRKHMQEAVMNDVNQAVCKGAASTDVLPHSSRLNAYRVVSYIVLPITYSARAPFKIVGQLVSLLPRSALLRLHEFTSGVAELARRALLRRRRAAVAEPPPEGAEEAMGRSAWSTGDLVAADDTAVEKAFTGLKCGWSVPDFGYFESETLNRLAEQFARRSSRYSRFSSKEDIGGSSCPVSGPCLFVCLSIPERASAPLLCDTRDLQWRV